MVILLMYHQLLKIIKNMNIALNFLSASQSQFISFCLPSFLSFPEDCLLFVYLIFNLKFYLTVCLTLSLSLSEYRSFFLLSASDKFHLVKNINFVLILFYDIQYEYFLTSLIWPVSKQNVFHFVKFLTIY